MKSCLVVDDSKVVRMVARKILADLEFEIVEAVDGKEALAKCGAAMPDAVLLDWKMPVMNGIEFLREMRTMPGGREPVVVFCTTEDDMSHLQEALTAGADETVVKPFDGEMIESKFSQTGLL